jgi:response regulator RpfG family c-di-GMP phosphodiesterase
VAFSSRIEAYRDGARLRYNGSVRVAQIPKKALLDRLLAETRITAEQYQSVRTYAERSEVRYEDALIDAGVMDEASLLKWLAALYKTRFVSTEKLSKAEIERGTLSLIQRPFAERHLVFPVVFDPKDKSLAFVLADPDAVDLVDQVRMHANVPTVKAYVARPAAVRAAIAKHYHGDIHAFGKVDPKSYQEFKQMMDTYERNVLDEVSMDARGGGGGAGVRSTIVQEGPHSRMATIAHEGPSFGRGATIAQDAPSHARGSFSNDGPPTSRGMTINMDGPPTGRGLALGQGPGTGRSATLVQEAPVTGRMSLPQPQREHSYERSFDSQELDRPGLPPRPPARGAPPPAPTKRSQATPQDDGTGYGTSIELVNVLVSLLENQRQELRGHSAQVARLMQKVGEHMGLDAGDVYALRLTGLLHDVGKISSYHLTALNVSEYEGHRTQAKKSFMGPVRLFEAASLPKACADGLTSVYERFDGMGFPDRKAGQDIPIAARLLAIAETYADLTSNARNPFRKTLSAKAAVEVLGRYKDKIFDGNLVDLFRVAALGEDMQSSLLDDRPRVLLVDADAEETTVLELRLVEQGHEVVLCRTAEQAYKRFQQGGIDALITEVDLKPHDGFMLCEYIRKHRAGAELPVFFLTRLSDRASADRGLALGAVDYIIKPAAPDVVVAKVRNVLAKSQRTAGARGVSGSLREMPLPDVLQVLARIRKTGLLKVQAGGYAGEIQFGNGQVYNASFQKLRNEDAVYALLALSDGEFSLDPSFVPSTRGIHVSTEQLLLEGMRRMDESGLHAEEPPADFSNTRVDDR